MSKKCSTLLINCQERQRGGGSLGVQQELQGASITWTRLKMEFFLNRYFPWFVRDAM